MKRFLIFALMFTSAALCQAQAVDQTKAMQRASRYFNEHVRPAGLRSTADAEPAAVTPWMAGDTTCMYAVQMDGGGWVLVSADDRTTASVLAYSENGTFDTNDMPDGMKWLLGDYADQILRVKRDSTIVTSAATPGLRSNQPANPGTGSAIYTPGEWLLDLKGEGEILWNQSWYPSQKKNFEMEGDSCSRAYNYFCPSFGLRSSKNGGNCEKAPTGCSAVAAGMIMRYWNWPLMALVPTTNGGEPEVVHVYKWKSMPASITIETSVQDAQMVSSLLRDIGFSAKAKYSSSGTTIPLSKLVAVFGQFSYHATISTLTDNWSETIRNDIDKGRPVICGGYRKIGEGHSFVIDGYSFQEKNLFHVNWGWAGWHNCYCTIDALTPNGKYIDGEQVSYSDYREIIYEIYPICGEINYAKLSGNSNIDLSVTAKIVESDMLENSGSLDIYADEAIFSSGFEIQLGASLYVTTPSYQYCQTQGPGRK